MEQIAQQGFVEDQIEVIDSPRPLLLHSFFDNSQGPQMFKNLSSPIQIENRLLNKDSQKVLPSSGSYRTQIYQETEIIFPVLSEVEIEEGMEFDLIPFPSLPFDNSQIALTLFSPNQQ